MAAATDFILKEIYDGLKGFRGSINELSNHCKCSREWVRLVLSGKYHDDALLQAAAEMWSEKQRIKAAGKTTINDIVVEARAALN